MTEGKLCGNRDWVMATNLQLSNIFPDGTCRTWIHDYFPLLCQAGKRGCDSCLLWAVLCSQCPCFVCWRGRGLLHQAPCGVLSGAAGCTTPLWPLLSLRRLEQSQSWLLLGQQGREEHWQKCSVPAAEQPDLLAVRWGSCLYEDKRGINDLSGEMGFQCGSKHRCTWQVMWMIPAI